MLEEVVQLKNSKKVKCANKDVKAMFEITHKGKMYIKGVNGKKAILNEVYFAPNLMKNLFSIKNLILQGGKVLISSEGVFMMNNNNDVILKGNFDGKFCTIEFEKSEVGSRKRCLEESKKKESKKIKVDESVEEIYEISYKDIKDGESLQKYLETKAEMNLNDLNELTKENVENLKKNIGLLWHIHLGHCSKEYLIKLSKEVPELKGVKFEDDILDCEICKKAKMTKLPNKEVRHTYDVPLHLVHTDTVGPINPVSYKNEEEYIVTFIDDYSRFARAYPMKDKKGVGEAFKIFLKEIKGLIGDKFQIRILRKDNGTEYQTKECKELFKKNEILCQNSEPYTPEHNSTAERFNRRLFEILRSILFDSKMPKCFWSFALSFALFIYNRLPHSRLNFKSPYEILAKREATLKYIRRFGCLGYIYDPKRKSKLDERGKRGFLVRCTTTGYELFQPETKKFIVSKNVIFIESKVIGDFYKWDDKKKKFIEIDQKEIKNESNCL